MTRTIGACVFITHQPHCRHIFLPGSPVLGFLLIPIEQINWGLYGSCNLRPRLARVRGRAQVCKAEQAQLPGCGYPGISDAEGRGCWVGVLSIPESPLRRVPDDLCPQWTESRSFSPFSDGPHLFSCLVVPAGWGPVAPLLPPPCL